MNGRLYYGDSYLRGFTARLKTAGPGAVELDQTAFYPTSGGQPHDTGSIGPARVVSVEDADGRIVHTVDRDLEPGEYACAIDWPRRFDHMQQHTGQHLLSAVLASAFGIPTLSFHLGSESATIDVGCASLEPAQLAEAEHRANAAVFENRPVTVSYHDAAEDIGLRKATGREGTIRVVTIADLDRSACGGTHVRSTAEIGPIQIRRLDRIRGSVRIEFVCGLRAAARARQDFDALTTIARSLSSALDDAPGLVAAQNEKIAALDKTRRKLAADLAAFRGKALWEAATPGPSGLRLHRTAAEGITDEIRTEAQAFTAQPGGIYVAISENPPALLLAVSADVAPAGATLKPILEKFGGRGGGNPRLAQGSLPTPEAARQAAEAVTTAYT